MAITVEFQGNPLQPVYTPFFFQVVSSNVAQPQFRYVFDVYKDGSYLQRVRMLPRPSTNRAIFSPARILESYLTYDLPIGLGTNFAQTNCTSHFTVYYGEEYGPTTSAPVVYSGLSKSSGYTFNGTVQYENYYTSENGSYFSKYFLYNHNSYPNNGKFLTNSPSGLTIGIDDEHSLSVFNYKTFDLSDSALKQVAFVEIKSYQNSGGSISSLFFYPTLSANTVNTRILHIPAGPKNINTMAFAAFQSGKWPALNTSTDYKYDITLYSASGPTLDVPISETRTFTFQDCKKYEYVRIMFLNRLGSWDYFNFRLVSRTTIASDKSTFKKNLPISYYYGTSVGDRENTVINTKNVKTKKAISDWITDEESVWLEELWTSPEVYEIVDSIEYTGVKVYLPVVVKTTSQEIKKRINDQIYNYEVEFDYASEVNTQRN